MVRNNNNKSEPKRYTAIVKINNNPDGSAYCVKYRFNDLLNFVSFLDKQWKDWKWFNVFSNKGMNKRQQIGNFTNRNRPIKSII